MTTATEVQTTQVYQLFIRATPEQIWDAITKPEFTEKYFFGARLDAELRPGGRYVQRTPDGSLLVEAEVVESDPPRKLVHGWRSLYDPELADEDASRVTWEIDEQDGGYSKLTVVHDELEGAMKTAAQVSGGWMMVLSGLKTLLETGQPLVQ